MLRVESCKRKRLCDTFDVALVDTIPGRSIGEYRELHREIVEGAVRARFVAESASYPASDGEFIALLQRLHLELFGAIPSIAGRFRRAGEDVWFGGERAHRIRGADAQNIEPALRDIFQKCSDGRAALASSDPLIAARVIADFFERFFRVHPFTDGNGRIARAFAGIALRDGGSWSFTQASDRVAGKMRRRYVKALEYAHRYAPQSEDPRHRRGVRHLAPLTHWVALGLEATPCDVGAEADEPPAKR